MMKQEVSPKVFIAVVAVMVLIAAGAVLWIWRAPTAVAASSSSSNADPHRTAAETRAMAQQKRQELMMLRKNHQGSVGGGDN